MTTVWLLEYDGERAIYASLNNALDYITNNIHARWNCSELIQLANSDSKMRIHLEHNEPCFIDAYITPFTLDAHNKHM